MTGTPAIPVVLQFQTESDQSGLDKGGASVALNSQHTSVCRVETLEADTGCGGATGRHPWGTRAYQLGGCVNLSMVLHILELQLVVRMK